MFSSFTLLLFSQAASSSSHSSICCRCLQLYEVQDKKKIPQAVLSPEVACIAIKELQLSLPYPPCDRGVPQSFAHQVSQQSVRLQEAQSDVGGFGEIPQQRRVGEVHGSWAPVYQRDNNL